MIDSVKIVRHLGDLETNRSGWTKELNLVDWGSGETYDIRPWSPDHTKCGKGVTLTSLGLLELARLVSAEVS